MDDETELPPKWLPTPEELLERAAEVRARWTPAEERKRSSWSRTPGVEIQEWDRRG